MRLAHSMLEMMTAVAVLAVILLITTQALTSGTAMRDIISARGESDDKVSKMVKDVTQDLRYADINRIYLDANNSVTWYQSGSTGDLYSFKTCTGFSTNQSSLPSMSRLIKYDEGIVLCFQQNPKDPTKGQVTRTRYQLDSTGVTTAILQPKTVIVDDLAWSYVTPDNPTVVRKGFEITQLANTGNTVSGNRLAVTVAMRPKTVRSVELTKAGQPAVSPLSVYSSSVFLRSTLFDEFGVLAPVITSTLTGQGNLGTAFRYDIKATNFPTSYIANPLPPGVTLDFRSGILSGIPSVSGTTNVVLTAQNEVGSDSKVLVIKVNGTIPAITSPLSVSSLRGSSFSYQIVATNSPTAYTADSVAGLPPGLTMSTVTGIISGTPTTVGTYSITLGATNANGTGTAILSLAVVNDSLPAPVITSPSAAVATIGSPFSFQVQASNSPASYTASVLPAGLIFAANSGLISGTPSAGGIFTLAVSATNAAGTGQGSLEITVQVPMPVVTSETMTGSVGTALAYSIKATNTPTAYGSSSNPSWLTQPSNTGVLSGTPTSAGNFSVAITATNSYGQGTGTVTFIVSNLTVPVISSVLTGNATTGIGYSYQISASNQPTAYYAAGLPAGLTLNATTGLISGIPTTGGSYSIGLKASNAQGTGPEATLALIVEVKNPHVPTVSFTANTNSSGGFLVTCTINAPSGYEILANTLVVNRPAGFVVSPLPNGNSLPSPQSFTITSSTLPGGLITLSATVEAKIKQGSTTASGSGSRIY